MLVGRGGVAGVAGVAGAEDFEAALSTSSCSSDDVLEISSRSARRRLLCKVLATCCTDPSSLAKKALSPLRACDGSYR